MRCKHGLEVTQCAYCLGQCGADASRQDAKENWKAAGPLVLQTMESGRYVKWTWNYSDSDKLMFRGGRRNKGAWPGT